jgi:hypothetical protein
MIEAKSKAIQFIGTQRSGSNLLRVMLNQLPQISAPHPPHILKTFFPLLDYYGDLKEDQNFKLLVADVCDWVNGNPVPWEDCNLEVDQVLNTCQQKNLIGIWEAIYTLKARADGATYWCCKSMESILYVNEIEASGVHPFYIYLYRDGRDVALSFKKAIVGPKHIYCLAKKWKEEQQMSLEVIRHLPDHRFLSIRYEDFLQAPGAIMKELCEKLQVPFTEDVFDYFHSRESINTAKSGAMWRNVAKPIIGTNVKKYEKELSVEDLDIFERVAGDMLNELGYPTRNANSKNINDFTTDEIDRFLKMDEQLRSESLKTADPADIENRRFQNDKLKEIKSRNRVLS